MVAGCDVKTKPIRRYDCIVQTKQLRDDIQYAHKAW